MKVLTVLSFIFLTSFIPQTERTYTITIPTHLAAPLFNLVNGSQTIDELTVGQVKELTKVVNGQLQEQSRKYFVEDSISQSKIKKPTQDTSKPHNK